MTAPVPLPVIRNKDRRWLEDIHRGQGGMYPGQPVDRIPEAPAARLSKAGLIETWEPHNPVHKVRWISTESGAEIAEQKP